MKKTKRKQLFRTFSRIISILLVMVMLTNDFLGGGAIVLSAEIQSDAVTESKLLTEEQAQEKSVQEQSRTENSDMNETQQEPQTESSVDGSQEEATDGESLSEDMIQNEEPEQEISQEEQPEDEDSILEGDAVDEPAADEETGTEVTEEIGEIGENGETEESEQVLMEQETVEEEVDFLAEDEPQTVLVLEEDITKRASNIKYFCNEDHSYTAAVYPDPVHYEEGGEWKEINNQLTDGEAEEGTQFLENSQYLFKVKFAKKSNGSEMVKLFCNAKQDKIIS